ncbi:hypothetical protein FRB96_003158 [Tulasnella sp. 330]|nr:hypothetical protein FRB96_003158 [Tulasnella sp. 330]KAG8866012.1 hypothetical protein FRB97_004275 [Tulasnella sp. 331]KAG8867561.1 hypothetical protein FRB98_004112 [Tulasnella sp. 332]
MEAKLLLRVGTTASNKHVKTFVYFAGERVNARGLNVWAMLRVRFGTPHECPAKRLGCCLGLRLVLALSVVLDSLIVLTARLKDHIHFALVNPYESCHFAIAHARDRGPSLMMNPAKRAGIATTSSREPENTQ